MKGRVRERKCKTKKKGEQRIARKTDKQRERERERERERMENIQEVQKNTFLVFRFLNSAKCIPSILKLT